MKRYEITIRPYSGFGTPLKGDTIFGHFCWQSVYMPSLVEGGIDHVLSIYDERPFAIFSSAFPKVGREKPGHIFKRPDIPLSWLFPLNNTGKEERYLKIKNAKKKTWMFIKGTLGVMDPAKAEFMNENQLCHDLIPSQGGEMGESSVFSRPFSQPHNTINRLTNTTGTGIFAPYTMENILFFPGTELLIFVLIDEELTDIQKIVTGLENIGRFGYGRDASTGMGRFHVCSAKEFSLGPGDGANAIYTLAPLVPEKGLYDKIYFSPFIRYGKHGDILANAKNPFKNPVIMADEGAVLVPKDKAILERPYVGRPVRGVSKAKPETVVQGYSPVLPMRLEQINENQDN